MAAEHWQIEPGSDRQETWVLSAPCELDQVKPVATPHLPRCARKAEGQRTAIACDSTTQSREALLFHRLHG